MTQLDDTMSTVADLIGRALMKAYCYTVSQVGCHWLLLIGRGAVVKVVR